MALSEKSSVVSSEVVEAEAVTEARRRSQGSRKAWLTLKQYLNTDVRKVITFIKCNLLILL